MEGYKLKNCFVHIVTPTYNRGIKLENLYKSLKAQTVGGFEWVVIDDGSIDNTAMIVKKMIRRKNHFKISYFKKENGGKHTALNYAFGMFNDGLIIIVDSDDYLTDDAVEIIQLDWQKYGNKKLCGLCYKKMYKDLKCACDDFGNSVSVANYNDFVINRHLNGDKTEVFRADILSKVRFPMFDGEYFLGEGVMWSKIAHKYDMVFINKPIYVCEYLENGLTMSGKAVRVNNPKGGMYHAEEYLDSLYSLSVREKNALLYLTYARFDKKRVFEICKNNKHSVLLFLNFIPSFLLYNYWRRYRKKNG